jgi:hypothetical protein
MSAGGSALVTGLCLLMIQRLITRTWMENDLFNTGQRTNME